MAHGGMRSRDGLMSSRRWFPLWLRGWLLLAMAVMLGAGVAVGASTWLAGSAAVAVGSVVATMVFGVFSPRGKALLETSAARRQALPRHVVAAAPSGRPRRVRESDDPIALRVHPAAALEHTVDGQRVMDRVPPYVPRDTQQRLWAAVAQRGFVLLVGDSTAGKTRAAYEAARAVLPDHVLIVPAGREALAAVAPEVLEQRRCVVWLDDLERFLGSGGLTPAMVTQMLGDPGRLTLLLGTMRAAEFDLYSPRQEQALRTGERDAWRAGRDVLDLAEVLELPRRWSADELVRARAYSDDPRIRAALDQTEQFGLAEALAAGPQLATEWRTAWPAGAHPRGAALVAAAVDCRRAGIHQPVPVNLIAGLAEHYLATQGGALLRPEPLAEALTWATAIRHGVSSLLLPHHDGRYLVFDYLIDLPGLDGIPRSTWDALIAHATPEQAFNIGQAAYLRAQWDIAVAAYRKADDHAVPDADLALARAVGRGGAPAEATRMLTEIVAERERTAGDDSVAALRARRHLAKYTGKAGDLAGRVAMHETLVADSERALGPDHPDTLIARFAYGISLYQTTMRTSPVLLAMFEDILVDQQRVLGPDHPNTMSTRGILACCVGECGDAKRAITLLTEQLRDRERMLGPDSYRVFQSRADLVHWTSEAGNHPRAVQMCRRLVRDRERVFGAEHPQTLETRLMLARYMKEAGEHERAVEVLNELLDDREKALGPGTTAATIAADFLAFGVFGGVRRSWDDRGESAAVLTTCQRLLGPEHPVTQEVHRLYAG
jgi:eukaryotic-like serine/threonine-protein kinase